MLFERLDVDPGHFRERVEIGEVAVVGTVFDDGVGVGWLEVGDEGEILEAPRFTSIFPGAATGTRSGSRSCRR